MGFGELIVKFTGIAIILFIIQAVAPITCGGSFFTVLLGVFVIGVGVYALYLRIQWDKKIIELAKKREKEEDLKRWRESRNHESRLKKIKKKP